MDDYKGNCKNGKIKIYIDKILEENKNKYTFKIIHSGYQLAIKVYK